MSGSAVTLTLVTVAEAGDAVTVGYTAPPGQSDARLQDLSGNSAGSFSGQAVTNNTAPAPVPGSPTGLQVALHESGQLLASWNAPGSGATPTGYTLQWKESGDDWADQDDVSGAGVTGTSHIITGLTDGTEYAVRVIATTDGARQRTLRRGYRHAQGNHPSRTFVGLGGRGRAYPHLRRGIGYR